MKAHFIIVLFLLASSNAFSQHTPEQTIDSIRKVLLLLKDTARVVLLNNFSFFYIAAEQIDSAEHYVTVAYAI
jgi:hypothetical protein